MHRLHIHLKRTIAPIGQPRESCPGHAPDVCTCPDSCVCCCPSVALALPPSVSFCLSPLREAWGLLLSLWCFLIVLQLKCFHWTRASQGHSQSYPITLKPGAADKPQQDKTSASNFYCLGLSVGPGILRSCVCTLRLDWRAYTTLTPAHPRQAPPLPSPCSSTSEQPVKTESD